MKKHLLLLLFALALATTACTAKQQEPMGTESQGSQSQEAMAMDKHNAKNSLDYAGVYQGLIADKDDLLSKVQLSLDNKGFYQLEIQALNDEASNSATSVIKKSSGKYTWGSNGLTITLDSAQKPKHFFVGENRLIMLDEAEMSLKEAGTINRNLTKIR